MQKTVEYAKMQLQLSGVRQEGHVLRVCALSPEHAPTAGVFFPERSRANVRPEFRAVCPVGADEADLARAQFVTDSRNRRHDAAC